MTKIVTYNKEYAQAFKALNMAWLEKHFRPEPYDIEVLSNPEKHIINKGGDIYFVLENNIPLGTVALMYNEHNELEFTKMAVHELAQGKGYGNLLMQCCIENAKKMDAKELILYSNTKLKPAIQLYLKSGFVEIPVKNSDYERCNIKMVLKL
ncbi:GNAT family N-acetyltransferase [uncultured Flavobacterium sp.]|uniref:GNAT family N-acetyltransferase n=1 Tax=uncultured Flavobacterium sp. TaxID=165435 RepID=UPI0030CA47F0|tara:strand:- start:10 stop:465 length:456 start_codon:yes stop_codon:yes gene_type:complete